MIFSPMILAGKTRIQLSFPGRNSRKNTVAVGKEFGIAEGLFAEERAVWSEGIRDWNVD